MKRKIAGFVEISFVKVLCKAMRAKRKTPHARPPKLGVAERRGRDVEEGSSFVRSSQQVYSSSSIVDGSVSAHRARRKDAKQRTTQREFSNAITKPPRWGRFCLDPGQVVDPTGFEPVTIDVKPIEVTSYLHGPM